MKTVLLIDISPLAHKAKHTTGDLSHEGMLTGIAFGVLRDIEAASERFQSDRVVLAFDSRSEKFRNQILPSYKSSRALKKTDEDRERDSVFYPQLDRLRDQILPDLGYRNIVEADGFEADDIIAAYAQNTPDSHEAIIVSSDHDLYQCLRDNVLYFNPGTGRVVTKQSFFENWGINPEQWATVKALAGCTTDDVDGIAGIGEKSAACYLAGTLKQGGKKWTAICDNLWIIDKNLPLVKLPLPGYTLTLPKICPDELSVERRLAVMEQLGFRSRIPGRKVPTFSEPGLF